MTSTTEKAQATLADPNFDVEGFVKNINIHYQNKQIVRALGANAQIVLGLIQGGEYRFLEIMPDFINPDIFQEMSEDGYTVYKKAEKKKYCHESLWFGVKITDELGLWYRRIGYQRSVRNQFQIIDDAETLKEEMKKWRKRGLLPIGEEREKKPPLPVYQIRRNVWDYVHKHFGLRRGWAYNHPTSSEFYWGHRKKSFGVYGGQNWNLTFTLLQAGKDHVRVKVECPTHEALVSHNATPKKPRWSRVAKVSFGKKFKLDEPDLCLKILDWAVNATQKNSEFSKNAPDFDKKLKQLKKEAGI